MSSVKTDPRARWFPILTWWATTLLIQGVILWLTIAHLSGPYFRFDRMDALKVAVAVLMVASVLARTRLPWLFLAINASIYLVLTIAAPTPLPLAEYLFTFICAIYAFASSVTMRTAVIVGVALEVIMVGSAVLAQGATLFHVYTIATTAAIAGATTIGQLAFSRRRLTDAANRRAREAERTREALAAVRVAEQRLAMARDLHDLVGHQITVINLHAATASRALPDRPEEARSSLAVIEQSAREIFDEVRDVLRDLREGPPRDGPATGSLDSLSTLVSELRAGGLRVQMDVDAELPLLPAPVDYAVYRILHEALVNAYKHGAHDEPVSVLVGWDGKDVRLRVSNRIDGREPADDEPGYGVLGVKERAARLGGSAHTHIRQDRFELIVDLPLDGSGEGADHGE